MKVETLCKKCGRLYEAEVPADLIEASKKIPKFGGWTGTCEECKEKVGRGLLNWRPIE